MNKEALGKISALLVAIAVSMGYPLVYGRLINLEVPEWQAFRVFDASAVGALSITLLLLSGKLWMGFWRRGWFNRIILGVVILVAGLEFFRMLRIDSGDFFGSYLYVTGSMALMILAAIWSRTFIRMLPYLALWFFVTGVWSYFGDYLGGFLAFGIAGNWNWSSALMVATAPVALMVFHRRLIGFERFGWLYMAVVVFLVLIALLLCPVFSRGVVVATAVSALAVGLLTWGKKYSASAAWGTFFVLLLTGMAFGYMYYPEFVDLCTTETRPVIYKIAWQIFVDNPVWGCSWDKFADAAASYKSMDYYLRPLASTWSPHAHNEILNLMSTGGVSGVLIVLMGIALVVGAMKAYCKRCTPGNAALLFMLLLLIVHGMFDMTLETIPAGFMVLICGGVLWGMLGKEVLPGVNGGLKKLQVVIRYGAMLLFGALTILIVASNIYSSYYERIALLQVKEETREGATLAIHNYNRAAKVRPTVDNLYQPIWILIDGFDRYNPDTALAWIRRFEIEVDRPNYRFLKYYKACALLKQGENFAELKNFDKANQRRKMALELLDEHTKMYPADFRGLELYRSSAKYSKDAQHTTKSLKRSNSGKMFFGEAFNQFNSMKQSSVEQNTIQEVDANFNSNHKIYELFGQISGSGRSNWGAVGLLMFGAWGLGIGLCKALGIKLENLLLESVIELTMGFYSLALAMIVFDKLILTHPSPIAFILGGLGLFGLYKVVVMRQRINQYIWSNIVLVLTILSIVGICFGAVYLPALAHDELVYQGAMLRNWAEAGNIGVRLDIPYSAFPSLGNFGLLYATIIGGVGAARMMVLAITVVALFGIGELLRQRCGAYLASAMICAYMLSAAAWVMTTQIQVECFGLLILISGLAIIQNGAKERKTWIISGWLGGMALALKLTCGMFAVIFWLMMWVKSPETAKNKLRYTLIMVIIAMIAGGVFFIRPYLATGNPLYPYFAEIFGTTPVEHFVGAIHHQMGMAKYGYEGAFGWFSLIGAAYDNLAFDGLPTGYGYLLLLMFGLGLTGYGVKKNDFKNGGLYLAGAWLLLAFWTLSAPQTRFMAPAIVLLMLASSGWMGNLKLRWRTIIAVGFLIAGLMSMPGEIFLNNCYAFFAVRRQVDLPSAYGKISPYSPAMWRAIIDSNYRKAMLIYEERGLYFPIPYVVGTPGFQGKFAAYREGAGAFYNELKANNIDCVVIGVGTGPDRVEMAVEEYLKMDECLAFLIKSGQLKIVTRLPDYWVLQVVSNQ